MIVHDVDQRTAAWHAVRAGKLTGSCAAILYAKPRKGAAESVQRRDLRVALAIERLTGRSLDDVDYYLGRDVERGTETEPEARAAYEVFTGELVLTPGFLEHADLPIGVSPDGLIGRDGGLELKCPKPAIQLERIRGGIVPDEYRYQILHSLYVTGRAWWDFASYCAALPAPLNLFVTRVKADDVDLAAHEIAVRLFLAEVDAECAAIEKLIGVAVA